MVLKFDQNEQVICKSVETDAFGYPAKVQEVEDTKDGRRYYIHYKGWNIRHDIWVEPTQVDNMMFKHSPELEAEHKRMLDESKGGKSVTKKKTTDTPNATTAKKRKTEREGSADSSQTSDVVRMPAGKDGRELQIAMPDKLKGLLLDDSDLINRQQKQVKLPAAYTVDMIVKLYGESIANHDKYPEISGNDEVLTEYKNKEQVMNKHDLIQTSLGILDYFNVLTGSQLLYARERGQYQAACVSPPPNAPGAKVNLVETPELEELKIMPSSVYGFAHLIRLFVKITPLLTSGNYGDKSLNHISKHMTDFLVFLSKNAHTYYDIERDYEQSPKGSSDLIG